MSKNGIKKIGLNDFDKTLATGQLNSLELDPEVKWSFYNVLPKLAVDVLAKIPLAHFHKNEDELEWEIKPSPSLNRVRHVFWRHFHSAKQMPEPFINYYKVCEEAGVSMSTLNKFLSDSKLLLWILCPIVNHHEQMMELYKQAIRKMREALNASVVTPTGEIDAKGLKEIVRIYELLDKRQHGEFVQSVNIKAASYNFSPYEKAPLESVLAAGGVLSSDVTVTHESIDAELKAIEEKLSGGSKVLTEEEAEEKEENAKLRIAARERGIKVKVKET